MDQKNYWDSVATTKTFSTQLRVDRMKKYVDQHACIVDIGCGYGRTLQELYENGYDNLIGVDFSENMIACGKSRYPQLDLRVKRSEKLEFEDQSVDVVILFAVLTCIINNEEQEALITEIKRVLKPGGILYINDFLLNEDERNISRYDQFKDKYHNYGVFELPEGALVRHHDEEWIKELLKDFTILEYEKIIHKTMNGNQSNGFFLLGSKK